MENLATHPTDMTQPNPNSSLQKTWHDVNCHKYQGHICSFRKDIGFVCLPECKPDEVVREEKRLDPCGYCPPDELPTCEQIFPTPPAPSWEWREELEYEFPTTKSMKWGVTRISLSTGESSSWREKMVGFIRKVEAQAIHSERTRIEKIVLLAVAEESNIARSDGFPTSRLTAVCEKILGRLQG